MIKYKIEYSWKDERQISLVIVAAISSNNELILLCDELFKEYSKQFEKLSFYFFRNRDSAVDYIYLRYVLTDYAENAIESSHCVGHLINNELTGRFSPPELLKKYKNPPKSNSADTLSDVV